MDRELNKDEIKFLKIIKKKELPIKDSVVDGFFEKQEFFNANKSYLENIDFDIVDYYFLKDKKYIQYNKFINTIYITPSGKSILDKNKNETIKFWLPTVISIVALAASITAILVSALVE